jgi:lipopolysaccharide transport protein LptA
MIAADILGALVRVNLAAGAAILSAIALRKLVRKRFGARVAYGLWLLPGLASAAVLMPARQVFIARTVAPGLDTALRGHSTLRTPLSNVASLDPLVLLLGLWLAGVAGAALIMALLQRRFATEARKGAAGPAVVGVIAPRVVTPADFERRYSREEQVLVLAHERTHIARQDSRTNGLCAAAQCLCWFNPLIHLAARLMRIDQELACDEAVVTRMPNARRAYAEVLLKTQLASRPLPLGCYWPSRTQHPLVERIAMLKLNDFSSVRRLIGASAVAVLCAATGLAAWAAEPAKVLFPASGNRELEVAQPLPSSAVALTPEKIAPRNFVASQEETAAAPKPEEVASGDGHDAAQSVDHAGGISPINVTADRGYTIDAENLLVWSGNVEVSMGGIHLRSDTLNTFYSGHPANAADAQPGAPARSGVVRNWGPMQKMMADGHVAYVSADKTATAEQAIYDPTLHTITLTGNVIAVQGQNVVKGDTMVIDVMTNHTTMSPE